MSAESEAKIILGVGKSQDDKNFVNYSYTREQWVAWLRTPNGTKKDGRCLVQGRVIGGRRLAKNMDYNSILMVDIDVGMSLDELEAKLKERKLGAVIWSTYSHLKGESGVKEAALTSWYRKAVGGELDVSDEKACADAVKQYLSEVKGYYPDILAATQYKGSIHAEGGIEYSVIHAPMPKYRALFFLKTPFSFSKDEAGKRVKQSDRITLWSTAYEAFCTDLGLPYDRSCVDPSRLMFTRRETKGASVFKVLEGEDLDLVGEWGLVSGDNPFASRLADEGATDTGPEFQTPGLLKFVAEYPDFDALTWAEHVGGDDKRDGTPQGGGSTWTCPNEDNHTEGPNPEDKGFCIFQDTTGQRPWGMSCRHSTCITMSNNDRVWYLDKMCQKYGADVDTMIPFSGKAKLDEAKKDAGLAHADDEKAAAKDGAHWPLIEKLDPNSAGEDLSAALDLVKHLDMLEASRAIHEISVRTKITKTALNKTLEDLRRKANKLEKKAQATANQKGGAIRIPTPPQNGDYTKSRIVHDDWNWEDKINAAVGILKARNQRNPRIFRNSLGEMCVISLHTDGDGKTIATMTPLGFNEWFHELNTAVCYQIVDTMGVNKNEPVPKSLVQHIMGMHELKMPYVSRVVTTPVIGPDGKVRTERGYQADLGLYLNPMGEYREVPQNPSSEDLDEAVYWLYESVRDFPFSDAFGTLENASIYQTDDNGEEIIGEDGYPLVNLERGASSRLNAFAFMITPQMRHLLPKGSAVPAFHIDKPAPGSGAGYLVDLVARITTGNAALVQTLSRQDEEIRKAITSALMGQPSILFLDNINHKVDSADIAAALTAGTWKDRLLGHSKMVEIDITSTWVFAGNNLSFSSEMIRRLVPIRLDANTARPAFDRPASMFKHNLATWSMENRANLLWSLQVLVVNWIKKGKPLPGQHKGEGGDNTTLHTMHTFETWADAVQGIFYSAGLDGVLANRSSYSIASDQDNDGGGAIIEEIAVNFGCRPFSVREVEECLQDPFGGIKIDLPFAATGNTDFKQRLRMWLERKFRGNVFVLYSKEKYGPKGEEFVRVNGKVKLKGHAIRQDGRVLYQLVQS